MLARLSVAINLGATIHNRASSSALLSMVQRDIIDVSIQSVSTHASDDQRRCIAR